MKRINFLIALFFMSVSIWAQDSAVTGTVSENGTNFPLIGVTVAVKGKQLATSTNQDGKYAIQANRGDELVFTYMGMEDVTRTVGSEKIINVEMREDNVVLEQVVVIGYGTVKKSDLTGAVGSISAKDLQANIGTGAASALQGRMPGVSVTSQTGQPGSGMNINIRGITSTSATTPLYVIDGVYGDINMIDPADIQSIEVLKDASAASIYGSRASAGVVLVTTKTGRRGMPSKISLNFYSGIQQLPKKVDVMDGEQWAGWMTKTGTQDVDFKGKGTDWQEEVYRSAPVFKGNLGITGGSETSSYSTSIGYTSQEGIMVNTGYEAINLRMKSDYSFLDNKLKIGESIIFKTSKQDLARGSSIVGQVFKMPPIIPVRTEDGNWGTVDSWMDNVTNPITDIYANTSQNVNHRKMTEMLANAYASLNIWDGIIYKVNLGLTRDNGSTRAFKDIYDLGSRGGANSTVKLSESNYTINKWLLENTLNYDKTFGKHTVYALAGYAAEKRTYKSVSASGDDIPVGIVTIPSGDKTRGDSFLERNGTLSMFGRLMYSFDSRYMLSASIRRDGSSRFADGYRWGNFESFSAGWNIHNESFASLLKPAFDELKVRASYGTLGNQDIGNYATQRRVTSGINYVEGDSWWAGGMPGINWVSPKDLSWETSETMNIGLDATLFKGKLTLTLDAYKATNKDLLMGVPMPGSAGLGSSPTMNAGTFINRGIELGATFRNTMDQVFYSFTGSATFLRNRMTEVTIGSRPELSGYNPRGMGVVTRARIGRPVSAFYLLETDGIFQSVEEVNAHLDKNGNKIQPNAAPGDIRYIDANGDGQISVDDEIYMGSGIPKTSLGFRANFEWKQFDLGFFFDAVMGNKLYNFNRWGMEAPGVASNLGTRVLDSWSEDNKGGRLPKYNSSTNDKKNDVVYSDRWLEKGDFLRLKTLEFGYTLPKTLLRRAKLDNVRIYTSFENLFTITAYKGYNPDMGAYDPYSGGASGPLTIGVDEGRYPAARVMSLGVQVNL